MEELHPELVMTVLGRLDGPSLAAAACAAAFLRRLSAQPHLWESICLSSWPSLRHHHRLQGLLPCFRNFFYDAYPCPYPVPGGAAAVPNVPPAKLVWAVDLFHAGEPLLSRLMETDTGKPWFLNSPMRVDALDRKAAPPVPEEISPEKLELSWLAIDPENRRAANLSSRQPVSVKQHWHTGEMRLRFAAVLGGAAAVATVAYGNGLLREVSLTLEDEDGKCLAGRRSLPLLQAALHGERRGGAAEEAKRAYADYQARKKERKEKRLKEEAQMNLRCVLAGVSLFLIALLLPLPLRLLRSAFISGS